MTKSHRAAATLLALALTAPAFARQGRLIGKVVDSGKRPIPGVKVTTTSPDIADFEQVVTSDDKGLFKVDFTRINLRYVHLLEKSGYVSLRIEQKWTLEGTERHEFKMEPLPAAAAATSPPASTSSPRALQAQQDLEKTGRLGEEAKRIYNEGVALSKSGDDAGAFAKFEAALAASPGFAPALVGLASSGLKIGRAAEAAAAAEALLEADPGNEQAIRLRYNAALKLGDRTRITEALVGLAAVDPVTARDGLFKLATAAYNADDAARAKPLFAKVLELDPSHASAHYFLGLVLMREGAKADAKSHLERFVELAPNDANVGTAKEALQYMKEH
jgi:Tfp pilus assembly protein PilF